MKRIVIIGGGFAGMWAAAGAKRQLAELGITQSEIDVVLVSQDAFLTIRPRLYETLADNMRVPLRSVLDPIEVRFVEATITAIDFNQHTVAGTSRDGARVELQYDRLVLAMGSVLHRPNVPGLAEHSFNVDTYDGAVQLDRHIRGLSAHAGKPGQYTVAVTGGGFTGIEVATEMVGRLKDLYGDQGHVVLIEKEKEIAPDLGANPRPVIEKALRDLNIEIHTGASVAKIDPAGVQLSNGTFIPALTTIWTAGLRANPAMSELQLAKDETGRAIVNEFLFVDGPPSVIAAGDVSRAAIDAEHSTLMSCQHAMTLGKVAGHNAVCDLTARPLLAYSQPRYVTCLDLGPWGALFTNGWDRTIQSTGNEAKQLKQKINTQWIYPPQSGLAADILAAASPTPAERNTTTK